jgi:AcrR family transcriptional regulator
MAEKGRRPGKRDTRAEIVAAARACFGAEGYDRVSLRAIAARARVDPALVHHYFAGGKAELFGEVMQDDLDPGVILDRVIGDQAWPLGEGGPAVVPGSKGAMVVANFVRMWDNAADAGIPSHFVSFMQAASSSPTSAATVRDFLADRIWSHLPDGGRPPDELLKRRALIASQLMGLGFARYVLHLEPMVDATPDELGAWLGPTIDRYSDDPLEDAPPT